MSPLSKRLPRELVRNAGKYLGLFLLIALTIAMAAGFLVAARSIQRIVADQRAVANMEDFSFTTQFEATDAQLAAVGSTGSGSTVYENFQADVELLVPGEDGEKTVRLYVNRTEFNRATYYEGAAPADASQIALDQTFCDEHGLALGDTVAVAGQDLTISGIMVLPDYQASVRSNSSMLPDNQTFVVSQVTADAFDELAAGQVTYRYAVILDDADMDLVDRTTYEKDAAQALSDEGATLSDLVDKDSMLSRNYADEDLEGDQSMWITLCAILVIVSAFVFVVLTDATVESESAMIGTLLASGYRKRELVAHYLALPTVVGLTAAAAGNAVGYGFMAELMSELYYNSYSFPPFHAYFDLSAFVFTTVVPVVLLFVITLVGVARKLRATPLSFLRREVGTRSRRSTMGLPESWGFVARFRLRVLLRNLSHFAVLFVGIVFSSLLIVFCMGMMPMIEHYADSLAADLPANHVYVLKAPLEIDVDDDLEDAAAAFDELLSYDDPQAELSAEDYRRLALTASGLVADPRVQAGHPLNTLANSEDAIDQAEKAVVSTLDLPRSHADSMEEVTIYGIEVNSAYWDIDVSGGKICIGAGLAEKCGLAVGEPATFTNRFTGETYTIVPDAIVGSESDTAVYMSRATWAELFADDEADGDATYFNAYVSDMELNLTSRYVASEQTPEVMSSMADQMMDSFGGMIDMVIVLAVGISVVLIYLLTKTTIDRSARYISYMKVFGYRNREVDLLYLRPITYTVVASYVLSLPLVIEVFRLLVTYMMARYAGNIVLFATPWTLIESVLIGLSSYVVVAALHVARVRRISLSDAMKVQE